MVFNLVIKLVSTENNDILKSIKILVSDTKERLSDKAFNLFYEIEKR